MLAHKLTKTLSCLNPLSSVKSSGNPADDIWKRKKKNFDEWILLSVSGAFLDLDLEMLYSQIFEHKRISHGQDQGGCESKVSEEKLKMALSHWRSVTTEIKEEVFLDPHDNEGTNRKGVYIFSMIH